MVHPPHRSSLCSHDRSHVLDSRFHGHCYSTLKSRGVFCDVCRLQRWLDIEVALAQSQAELGMIPVGHAEAIAAAAHFGQLDHDAIADAIRATGHSLVGLLRALEERAGQEAATSVHLGATTQDIQDTGQALEMRDVLDLITRDLHDLLGVLRPLAIAHRETLMIGRTHARPALPMTFGLKVAGWIDELVRHLDRIGQARARIVVAQLSGGVGTMVGFGDRGPELLERFAHRLGLGVPVVSWHAIRDRVAEFGSLLGMIASSAARIADEVRLLGRPEFDELEEVWSHGQIGSSTMPHKRNPEVCEQIVVMARLARAQVPVLFDAMLTEHERDGRTLRLEWPAVAEVSHYTLTSLSMLTTVLAGLRVRGDVMGARAHEVSALINSEAIMLALAEVIGKTRAYQRIYRLSQDALSRRVPLRDLLAADPEVRLALGHRLEALLEPAQYLGASVHIVDRTIAELDRRIAPAGGHVIPILAHHREVAAASE